MCSKTLGKDQWEWIAAARMLSRYRPSTSAVEEVLDELLSGADQAMVNAFTGGFRVAQTRLAISKVVPEPVAAAALESAQIVALAILVREQIDPAQFAIVYRPFATVVPGPGYQQPPTVDRQIATFLQRLPTLSGDVQAEVVAVAKAMNEPAKTAVAPVAGAPAAKAPAQELDVPALYAAAWKAVIAAAYQADRTQSFRAAQEAAEFATPHDGSGIVAVAGVAAGGLFLRDLLPIEQVLLLYEPFAAAFPYESLT